VADRDALLTKLMQAANRGDAKAYRRVLEELAPILRGLVKRRLSRYGLGAEEAEDVVQETLLAVHLKRQTWDERQPLLPWVRAIAQNKLVDSLRRRGRHVHVPLDELSEAPAVDDEPVAMNGVDAKRVLSRLEGRQRDIVLAISIEGASARQVADRLGMTEGAVRVALHRALKSLAAAFRSGRHED
jgi:RNA polymerase sigma factor (sigma-70 family)